MKLIINELRCKGCNLCSLVCPYKIFFPGSQPGKRGYIIPQLDRPERCTNVRLQKFIGRELCEMCKRICPDQAILWREENPMEEKVVEIEY